MARYSVFDIIGPVMIGPSSSHTAGAVRLARAAGRLAGGEIQKVTFILHGSFAKTCKGHGTDKALLAGIMGLSPEDERIRIAYDLARQKGIVYEFCEEDMGNVHPNTVKFIMENAKGEVTEVTGSSIGGGNILITEINGLPLEFSGEYPTLIIRHTDVPGVIAGVTQEIAQLRVNIAFMKVFRRKKGSEAFMIIEMDSPLPGGAVEVIMGLPNIAKAYMVDRL